MGYPRRLAGSSPRGIDRAGVIDFGFRRARPHRSLPSHPLSGGEERRIREEGDDENTRAA